MEKIAYKIEGLDCAEEVAVLKKVVGSSTGIEKLDFNILSAKMEVTFDPKLTDSSTIIGLISRTGMKARIWEKEKERKASYIRPISTLISFLALISAILVHYFFHKGMHEFFTFGVKGDLLPPVVKILYLIAIAASIWMVIPKAYFALTRIRPDMNLLMVAAILGAIGIGEWFEAAMVAFLFSLALLLEELSIEKARRTISNLLNLAPPRALLYDKASRQTEEKPVEEIKVDDLILVRPGEKISLDGLIEEGKSSIDESPITGESLPVTKDKGDEVYAGTLNQEGALEIRVTKRSDETTLAKIIQLVEEAKTKRSGHEKWVESFARIYTPIMFLLALSIMFIPPILTGDDYAPWIYRGLVLLVIACPCALVISTPVSIVAALTAAANNGVLVKGGVFLEILGGIKTLALDKTGTLTLGRPIVQTIFPLNNHTEEELLVRAAGLEQKSEHPIAHAVLTKAETKGISYPEVENYQVLKGKGAKGTLFGKNYWIGSHRFMHDMGQETDEIHNKALSLEDAGHTMLAIGTDDHVCGLITVADAPRPGIEKTITALKTLGVNPIVMLTGDNAPTASAIAKLTGIDVAHAELLPQDKVAMIETLRKDYGRVAMVGDGINDAPALATADIGIAMGGMGTDVAIEVSDISLVGDDLAKVPWLIEHSRKTLRVIKQNITFALVVKGIFFTLALFNLATLWMAIAADTGATLIVIFHALRLIRKS